MASRLDDAPAPILADLAAAYLVRAGETNNPRDLLEAAESAQRSLEHDPNNIVARYNLALALDEFGLAEEAQDTWSATRLADRSKDWQDQETPSFAQPAVMPGSVSSHSTEAELASYAQRAPQDAGTFGWDRLLGEWGNAIEGSDTTHADSCLSAAGILGDALERSGADGTLAAAVRSIRAHAANPRELARLHADYAAARSIYVDGNYRAAGPRLHAVLASRGSMMSPTLRAWATVFWSATLMYAGRLGDAARAQRRVIARVDTLRYPGLAGRALWAFGTTLLRSGRKNDALLAYAASARLFVRAREHENVGAVEGLMAETFFALGHETEGYAVVHRALRALMPSRGSVWLHNLLLVTSQVAAADDMPRTSALLEAEEARVARRTEHALYVAEALVSRASTDRARGRDPATDLDSARFVIASLPTGEARRWLETQARYVVATDPRGTDSARSVAALDSIVAFFAQMHTMPSLANALAERARIQFRIGDPGAAALDVDSALRVLDRAPRDRSGPPISVSDARLFRSVISDDVMWHVRGGRSAAALAVLEHGRASLDPFDAGVRSAAVTLRMPSGCIGLEYMLIGDTLLTWTVLDTAVRLSQQVVSRSSLVRTIDHLQATVALRSRGGGLSADLASLYDVIVRPLATNAWGKSASLRIVADDVIAAVPFAALYDRAAHEYMIERRAIEFVPSLRSTSRARVSPHRSTVLLVADPAFNVKRFPDLVRLPGAVTEVHEIAGLYANPQVLAGAEADRRTTAERLRNATLLHYAGHALFDDERPERSRLVLADAAGDTSVDQTLEATDIAKFHLPDLDLVVLSSCETLHPGTGVSSGLAGLAGAFLTAGSQGVIGSLWPVDDEETRELMVAFHQAYHESREAPSALREAQMELLRSPNPALQSPAAWGAFRYVGH
jgi:CHAT domain-containing protein/tetratricopeptide (TPR) repeat protein